LSIRRGGRVRYVGQTFWGFVAGKVSLARGTKRTEMQSATGCLAPQDHD
jgi:hypothetical protein